MEQSVGVIYTLALNREKGRIRFKTQASSNQLVTNQAKYWHGQCYGLPCVENHTKGKLRNMKSIKPLLVGLAAMVVAAGFALSAQATQINGTLGFTSAPNSSGGSIVSNGGGSYTLNFNNPMHVDFGSGDYTAVPVGTTTNFASVTFQNGGGLTSTNVPEWTFTVGATTYSFDLLSLS